MNDIRNLSIWKEPETKQASLTGMCDTPIDELCLSVRSYNCLKRAECNTIGDIVKLLEADEDGLKRIRNLGKRSEEEILKAVQTYREKYTPVDKPDSGIKRLVKPARKMWGMDVEEFRLSERSRTELNRCGITKLSDLYEEEMDPRLPWRAVRELFEAVLNMRHS